jgi:hypothetical protein
MKYIFRIIFFFLPSAVLAQPGSYNDSTEFEKINAQQLTGEKYLDLAYRNINIFFKNHWNKGSIVLPSGETVNNLLLRYDGLQDRVIWLNNRIGEIKLDKQNISEFYFYDTLQYHFRKLNLSGARDSSETFCQVLYEGNLKLYASRKVRALTDYFVKDTKYFIYVPKPAYYILINSRLYILSRARIKSIYNAFPDKKESLRQRIKQERLRVRNEQDFIKTIRALEDILIL